MRVEQFLDREGKQITPKPVLLPVEATLVPEMLGGPIFIETATGMVGEKRLQALVIAMGNVATPDDPSQRQYPWMPQSAVYRQANIETPTGYRFRWEALNMDAYSNTMAALTQRRQLDIVKRREEIALTPFLAQSEEREPINPREVLEKTRRVRNLLHQNDIMDGRMRAKEAELPVYRAQQIDLRKYLSNPNPGVYYEQIAAASGKYLATLTKKGSPRIPARELTQEQAHAFIHFVGKDLPEGYQLFLSECPPAILSGSITSDGETTVIFEGSWRANQGLDAYGLTKPDFYIQKKRGSLVWPEVLTDLQKRMIWIAFAAVENSPSYSEVYVVQDTPQSQYRVLFTDFQQSPIFYERLQNICEK